MASWAEFVAHEQRCQHSPSRLFLVASPAQVSLHFTKHSHCLK